ncbi:MAG TPA: PQQ-binding-like beta-propeller repeat protein, partial [Bryobacteraceae bacterium]|nr:PQQ-binding-like beta-propeller repeat protein [Bryobacteraceae bacterium]
WKRALSGTVLAPTTVANGLVYAASTTGVAAFDAWTGDTVWEDGTTGISYAQPVVVDGTLYTTYLVGDVIAWRLPPPPAGNAKASRPPAAKPVRQRKP